MNPLNPTPSHRKTTVFDVAKLAGVSVGTVSRVINDFANVTDENRERVAQAMKELGYVRQKGLAGASKLSHNRFRTQNIGLVYADASEQWANHPLLAAYTMGVERATQEYGLHTMVEMWTEGDPTPRCISDQKIDGLLLKSSRQVPSFIQKVSSNLPVILIGLNDPLNDLPQFAPDNHGAGWMVAHHLWERGHRRIAFLSTEGTHPMFLARGSGYESFLRARGAFDPALRLFEDRSLAGAPPELSPPDMTALLQKVLRLPEPPTAIITANDWMARGLYTALAQAGFKVPGDMSVIGFDNEVAVCTSMAPALTSHEIAFAQTAYAAAHELIQRIESPSRFYNPSVVMVRGTLVERESVRSL